MVVVKGNGLGYRGKILAKSLCISAHANDLRKAMNPSLLYCNEEKVGQTVFFFKPW